MWMSPSRSKKVPSYYCCVHLKHMLQTDKILRITLWMHRFKQSVCDCAYHAVIIVSQNFLKTHRGFVLLIYSYRKCIKLHLTVYSFTSFLIAIRNFFFTLVRIFHKIFLHAFPHTVCTIMHLIKNIGNNAYIQELGFRKFRQCARSQYWFNIEYLHDRVSRYGYKYICTP